MFSGPDFLYVDAFFPNRTTYVMSGLEPVGQVPVVTDASRRSMGYALAGLRQSVGSSLDYSFFRTKQMRATFSSNRLKGVLPVIYLFLARSGKTIHEVTLIGIDADGQGRCGRRRVMRPRPSRSYSRAAKAPRSRRSTMCRPTYPITA